MVNNAIEIFTYLSSIKDSYLKKHHQTVSFYAVRLAKALELPMKNIKIIQQAALLHDTGKIGIPNSILFKSGPLTLTEWEIMKLHPVTGAELLSNENMPDNEVISAVRHHHERWDGSGYPDGLTGKDIPLPARVIAVADAFDAMTTNRPYKRNALSEKDAIQEMIRCSGTQFDPRITQIFLNSKINFRLHG